VAQRILLLAASIGGGHVRAAEAVELALREAAPDSVVRNLDVLQYTNAAFRRIYDQWYWALVGRCPHLVRYLYDTFDLPPRSGAATRGDRLRQAIEKVNLRRLARVLEAEPWDLVINTHFLPADLIACLRRGEKLTLPHVTVTTDFETHRYWVNQPCEHYFTATEESACYLRHLGVPPADVSVTGIPIHPAFARPRDRAECLAKHELPGDRPVVVQLAGGFGVGPIEKVFQALLDVEVPIDLVTITGRNERVRAALSAVPVPRRHRVRVLGFTREIDEWMTAADLVVSKPGGLTVSEALACGAAMVVVNPVPGQEDRNCDFLLENGVALKANQMGTLAFKVTELLRDPGRLARMRASARRLARPDAARAVVDRALRLIDGRPRADVRRPRKR
jgi:processive 1,2-diacylglycerol beta-glucosyltransferase